MGSRAGTGPARLGRPLGILAVLAEATEADFTYLRKVLGLTDGNLGRHLEITSPRQT